MRWLPALLALLLPNAAFGADRPMVAAAEAVYADIAAQIGGPDATVAAIMTDPAADPHVFVPTAATAATLSSASIVIYNGAGYDPWMRAALTTTAPAAPRRVIDVADLLRAGDGKGNTLWYDPRTMPVLATAIARAFEQADPDHAAAYDSRLTPVLAAIALLNAKVAVLRAAHAGQTIATTGAAFAPMIAAIGLRQDAAAATAADLRHHRVRALLEERQTNTDDARRLVRLAADSDIPVVQITETLPPHVHYQAWVSGELNALDKALLLPQRLQ